MNKPTALIQLLDELQEEFSWDSTAITTGQSSMRIIFGTATAITLTKNEAELVLNSANTVAQLYEALNEPSDCAIELHGISLDDAVRDALERTFSAVDEV